MKLISWNMNQQPGNWAVLADLMGQYRVDAAMVQEAVAPPGQLPSDLRVFADPSQDTAVFPFAWLFASYGGFDGQECPSYG